MVELSSEELIQKARSVVDSRKIRHGSTIGDVGCALITGKGNLYLGVSIDTCCGIGFCAEHSAVAAMVTHGEQVIRRIVAVNGDGKPISPCGRCRELISQISDENFDTEVIVSKHKSVKLRDLLPFPWDR